MADMFIWNLQKNMKIRLSSIKTFSIVYYSNEGDKKIFRVAATTSSEQHWVYEGSEVQCSYFIDQVAK